MKPDIRPNSRQQTAMMIEAMQAMELRAKLDREDRIAEIVGWTITGLIAVVAIVAAFFLLVAA